MEFPLEKLEFEVDAELAAELRRIAEAESRTVDSVVTEAFNDLLIKRGIPRPMIVRAYKESIRRFGPLYERLADS